MAGLWRNDRDTREGKYLVLDRGGEPLGVPCMVLGARDPHAPAALEAYARSVELLGPSAVRLGPEGYSVVRRDGTAVEWPFVVMRADDPLAPDALEAYAAACRSGGLDPRYVADVFELAASFRGAWVGSVEVAPCGPADRSVRANEVRSVASSFRSVLASSGAGDPDGSRHRKDDPGTVERMKGGEFA